MKDEPFMELLISKSEVFDALAFINRMGYGSSQVATAGTRKTSL
jgi:hypothetical protein